MGKTTRVVMLVLLLVAGTTTGVRAATAPAVKTFALDQAHFWNGGYVAQGAVRNASLCGVAGPCFTWKLRLAGGAFRLRVGIDTPSREDTFAVSVIDPAGTEAGSTSNSNQFNAEAFVPHPRAGLWSVVVRPVDVSQASFRLRAKLEKGPAGAGSGAGAGAGAGAGGKVALLPNLRAVPPYEFGFTAPATPNGPYPPDRANPPAEVAGQSLMSCTPDESAPASAGGSGAVDCLRLTSGPMNIGDGPFDLRFTFADDMENGKADPVLLRGPITQAVHYSDGSVKYRPAGHYIFHTTHSHFHDENILTYEIFHVSDAKTGRLVKVGQGVKSGFCPADQLIGRWFEFNQVAPGDFGDGDTPTGNCFSPTDGSMGLTKGWGDVYRWQRPGQYVEFSGQGDGQYVVRSTVDKANNIAETNDDDNAAYALIKVVGRSIRLIERGQGLSPWDANKLVFVGDGPASIR